MIKHGIERVFAKIGVGTIIAHLLLTVANNLPGERVRFTETLISNGIEIPRWKFFGPFPGVSDFSVFARELIPTGEKSRWFRIDHDVERPWYAIFWNPENRKPKVLFDSAQQIKMLAGKYYGEPAVIESSLPFLLLRSLAEGKGFGARGEGYQIMLVESKKSKNHVDSSPYFVSGKVSSFNESCS